MRSRAFKGKQGSLSRRDLGRWAVTSAAAVVGSPAARPQTLTRDQELEAAKERRLNAAGALAKFQLPVETEPATTFRPL